MDVLGPIRRFDRFQQQHKPLAVLCATVKKFSDDQAGNLAVVVGFYAFFSLFPLLLVFVTVLGYVLASDPTLMESVSDSVLGSFPVIGDTIQGQHLKGDALALIVGIALSLWSGTGLTGAMSNALEQVWEIPRTKRAGFAQKKIRGLLVLLLIGTLFALGSAASGVVSGGLGGWPLRIVGIVVSLLINLGMFMVSFHLLCEQPPDRRDLLPGAVLAAVFWTALQSLGGVYIEHIKHSNSAYGTFALVLGLLAWLHLGTQLTLYAVEFSTVITGKRWPRSLFDTPDDQPAQAIPLGGDEPVPGPPLHAPESSEHATSGS
jgi:inner membrane protein YhjD